MEEGCHTRHSLLNDQYYDGIGFGMTRGLFDKSLVALEIGPPIEAHNMRICP